MYRPTMNVSDVRPGCRVVSDGKGWVVRAVEETETAGYVRVRLYAPWRGGERTSFSVKVSDTIKADVPPCGHGQEYRLGCLTCEAWAAVGDQATRP